MSLHGTRQDALHEASEPLWTSAPFPEIHHESCTPMYPLGLWLELWQKPVGFGGWGQFIGH